VCPNLQVELQEYAALKQRVLSLFSRSFSRSFRSFAYSTRRFATRLQIRAQIGTSALLHTRALTCRAHSAPHAFLTIAIRLE
jgi:hypothetical protein